MLFVVAVLLVVLLVVIFSGKPKNQNVPVTDQQKIQDRATGDTPVETLKTLTAELTNVDQQNKKIIADNKQLKENNKNTLVKIKDELMRKLSAQLHQTLKTTLNKKELSQGSKVKALRNDIEDNKNTKTTNNENKDNHQMSWVSDMRVNLKRADSNGSSKTLKSVASLLNPNVSSSGDSNSVEISDEKKEAKPFPYYTMPVGSTLTGAILMEPLVGRIPINGTVPDPYHFKVILGPKNLAANGVDIPSNVQGIVATGYSTGDMLRSCASGKLMTMTFVFPDGRISTTLAKDDEGLGYISSTSGDPCLIGSFHTNAAEYLGGSSLLAGIQGYANALSQAQTSTTTSQSGAYPSVSTIVKNGNKYALGQGMAAGAQNAQNWWNQRVQSSFDYVYVPNVNSKTGKLTKVDIHIMQPVDIDYNPVGRKVSYDHSASSYQTSELD